MVRRMKSELPPKWDGSPRFPKRVLDPIEVPYTDEERGIHAALREYAESRAKRAQDNTEKLATEFVLKTLKNDYSPALLHSLPLSIRTRILCDKPNGERPFASRRLES